MTVRSPRIPACLSWSLLLSLTWISGCGREHSGVPTVADRTDGVEIASAPAGSPEATAPPEDTGALPEDPAPEPPAATAASPVETSPAPHGEEEADRATSLPERKLFEGWETPRVALLVTGQQHGYIEPCGCTQLVNQKGGLARRHTLVKQLSERNWPLVGLDAGNQVRRFGRQAEIKFHMSLDGLKTLGYQGIVLGVDDLRLSVDELIAASAPLEGETTPFLCANAAVLDWSLMPAHKVIEQGGTKIGVTAILGAKWKEEVTRDDVVFKDPAVALLGVIPKLQQAACDVLVLLAHTSVAEAKQLARDFPEFHVVVAAGAAGDGTDPLYQPEKIEGSKTMFVQTGIKGMFAGVIGVFDDPETPLRYQRVPLDASYEDSPEMLALLKSYQNQLETVGLSGLGLQPVSHPSGNTFTGSEKCGECHTTAFSVWENTPHATATDSLVNPVERAGIQRHFDPECLSCHVTGWHPQRFFPFSSGYLDLEKSAAMHGNGCENCHGPGSAHVAAEEGDVEADDEMLATLRASMRLTSAAIEKKCIECHDIDNSPNFYGEGAYQHYLKEIEHIGLD